MPCVLSIDHNVSLYSKGQNSLESQFLQLVVFRNQKIHERMLFESVKIDTTFFEKILHRNIFYV